MCLHLHNYFWQELELRLGVSSNKQPNDGKPARRSCKASWSAVWISLHGCMIVWKLIRTWLCTVVSTNIKQAATISKPSSKPSLSKSLHQRTSRPCASPQEHSSTSTLFDFDTNGIDADNFNPCSGLRQATPRLRTLLSSNHIDHVPSGSAEL